MSVVKGGLIWNFFCTFIVSSVYDSSGSGINKVKILVSTIKAAPSCGFNFVFVFGFFFWYGWKNTQTHKCSLETTIF